MSLNDGHSARNVREGEIEKDERELIKREMSLSEDIHALFFLSVVQNGSDVTDSEHKGPDLEFKSEMSDHCFSMRLLALRSWMTPVLHVVVPARRGKIKDGREW